VLFMTMPTIAKTVAPETPPPTMAPMPTPPAPLQHRMSEVRSDPPAARSPDLCPDEKRDSDKRNDYQGGTRDEHIPDIIARGASSDGDLVLFSYDRSFVRIHLTLLSRELGATRPIVKTRGSAV
jgi:hypothetical protein